MRYPRTFKLAGTVLNSCIAHSFENQQRFRRPLVRRIDADPRTPLKFAATAQLRDTISPNRTMSHSTRDIDLRRMRQLARAKSELIPKPCSADVADSIMRSPAYSELQAKFDQIFAKYGCNPSIFHDSERAGSKRAVGRKIKEAARRNEKRAEKQRARRDILQPPNDSSVALRVALANPPETESNAPHEQG